MAIIAKENSGGSFELIPADQYAAVCYRVIDLGTQKTDYQGVIGHKRQIMISWELDAKMEDGRPFAISKWYTLSLSEKSSLRPDLESWRGKAFTSEELEGFDISKLLKAPCLLQIVHKTSKQGHIKAAVNSIMKLPKAMTAPAIVNDIIDFSLDEFNQSIFDMIPEGIQKMIVVSPEYMEATKKPEEEEVPSYVTDTEIPF